MTAPRRLLRLATAGVTVLSLLIMAAVAAEASFTRSRSASRSVTVATLAPPTGVSLANVNCVVLGSQDVRVDWTASTSTFVGGYEVRRALTSNGSYTLLATITGAPPAVTYLNTGVASSTTYWYKLRSIRSTWNWLSVETTPVSITTPSTLCVI